MCSDSKYTCNQSNLCNVMSPQKHASKRQQQQRAAKLQQFTNYTNKSDYVTLVISIYNTMY